MTELELCWRCGLVQTQKRVDGKPVCGICFLADARANKGIVPSYADLTPIGVRVEGSFASPYPKPKTKRRASKKKS